MGTRENGNVESHSHTYHTYLLQCHILPMWLTVSSKSWLTHPDRVYHTFC